VSHAQIFGKYSDKYGRYHEAMQNGVSVRLRDYSKLNLLPFLEVVKIFLEL
jgi:hypothetical protein